VKCQVCGEAEATIHFKELKHDEMRELHLCPACAEEKGLHAVMEQDKLSLANQFIWMAENLYPENSAKIGQVQCTRCGLRYGEFTRLGRFGCMDCYSTFDVQIRRLLRRVHGATQHAGKRPGHTAAPPTGKATLHRLQEELQRAIASENFERAAELRDRIRALESAPVEEEGQSA
jgi:protein arginine kinase activator